MAWERRKDDPRNFAPRKPKAKKNTRKWCRGKVGVEHVLVVRIGKWGQHYDRKCDWSDWMPNWYSCIHEEACKNCGKILSSFMRDRCPDRPDEKEIKPQSMT